MCVDWQHVPRTHAPAHDVVLGRRLTLRAWSKTCGVFGCESLRFRARWAQVGVDMLSHQHTTPGKRRQLQKEPVRSHVIERPREQRQKMEAITWTRCETHRHKSIPYGARCSSEGPLVSQPLNEIGSSRRVGAKHAHFHLCSNMSFPRH